MSSGRQSLRIASYNIRKSVGTDRRRDPDRILDIIAGLEAQIVVLQEADFRLGRRNTALPLGLIESRTGLIALQAATHDKGVGWHGNAILMRPDIAVSALDRVEFPGLEPRGAVIADLQIGATCLRIVGLHLGLMRASRRLQLSALLLRLQGLSAMPTVLAGDMNEWSQKVGLGRIAKHFTIHAPGKSFHARLPVAALDRIALDDGITLLDGGVLDTARTRLASDHLPIWVNIAWGA